MSIVLLGQIGSGKTTLYNKITNSQEKYQSGGDPSTMNVFMKKSSFGQGFSVLDTPGFGAESDKIDYIAGVLFALSQGPINRIFIVARFARTNTIMEDVKQILPAFMNYRHMITVIITCWDCCEQKAEKEEQEKNKKDIKQRLEKYKINSVMFVGKNDTPQSLCLQIDQIIATSQAQNVTLTDNDIFKNFDLTEYDEEQIFEIEFLKGDLIKSYNFFSTQAKKLIVNNNISKGLLADYYYAITQFALKQVEDTIRKFESQTLQIIDKLSSNEQLKAFQIHFQLKSTLFKDYESIVDATYKQIHNGNHFSKYIRKCYYCGEIWFKVAGCDGQTICGSLNDNHLDEFIKQEEPPHKFIVTYNKEKLEVKLDESFKPKAINYQQRQKISVRIEERRVDDKILKVGGTGCKRIIDWSKMYLLTEEELKTVLGLLDIQFYEKMVEFEKQIGQKTLNQQLTYKYELEKKIKEQNKQIIKAV